MFCPKCGVQNPETGKFCRSCGTDLGNITDALSGKLRKSQALVDKKGKPVNFEGAITKTFTGFAFLIIAIILAITGAAGAKVWWFWMLIPAFGSLGAGVAQYIQLKKQESGNSTIAGPDDRNVLIANQNAALPPLQTEYVKPESRYKTGDLVPPSVTDGTTKHLEMNSEGETMTLPKR
ncbi:MAG: zinc ribbon domain-containing protein [Acidobacteriota bacterium]|nr:zinc ribbon domain-containing protein [Acidobacteriota bacterium]